MGLLPLLSLAMTAAPVRLDILDFGAKRDSPGLNTAAIQAALDACAERGGGTVVVPKGLFRTGGLRLRSRTTLRLEEGAILRGSEDPADYGGGSDWTDALLKGVDVHDVRIEGPGTLDGADCRNPKGEEGFRGPHAVWMERARNFAVEGITIVRSANWAFNCKHVHHARIRDLKVRGGHDGFDASDCTDFRFERCDFRSGDDCVAGANNRDFHFEDCLFNTACNGFRFACFGMTVRRCRFWGPGESIHRISGRHNMINAFVHFSPPDRGYAGAIPHSDRWLIEDCEVDGVDGLYEYNYRNGLWQTGQPVAGVRFHRVRATNLARPVVAIGDAARQCRLEFDGVDLGFRAGHPPGPHVRVEGVGALTMRDCVLRGYGEGPGVTVHEGDPVTLAGTTDESGRPVRTGVETEPIRDRSEGG